MDPLRKICQLSNVEDRFDPIPQALSFFSMSSSGVVLTPQAAKEVYKLRLNRGKLSMEEREGLLPSMQKLCNGLPITRVEEVLVNEAEYENGSIDIFNSTSTDPDRNHRTKRAFYHYSGIVQCDEIHDRCTENGSARYCVWYTCASFNVGGRCSLEHLRSGSWRCLKCCNNHKAGLMCKCDEIRDEDSFKGCQDKNWNH